jgi:hypothetical protein
MSVRAPRPWPASLVYLIQRFRGLAEKAPDLGNLPAAR